MKHSKILVTLLVLFSFLAQDLFGQSQTLSEFTKMNTMVDTSANFLVFYSKALKKKGVADRNLNIKIEPEHDFLLLAPECNKILVGSDGKKFNDGGGFITSEAVNLSVIDVESNDIIDLTKSLRVVLVRPYDYQFASSSRVLLSDDLKKTNIYNICDNTFIFDKSYASVSNKSSRFTYAFTILGSNEYKYSIVDLETGKEIYESEILSAIGKNMLETLPVENDVAFTYEDGAGFTPYDLKSNQNIGSDSYEKIDFLEWENNKVFYLMSGNMKSSVLNPVDHTFAIEGFEGKIKKFISMEHERWVKTISNEGSVNIFDLNTKKNLLPFPCDDYTVMPSDDYNQLLCNMSVVENGVQKMGLYDAVSQKFIVPLGEHVIEKLSGFSMSSSKNFVRYNVIKDGKAVQYRNTGDIVKPPKYVKSNQSIRDNYKWKKGDVALPIKTIEFKYRYKYLKDQDYRQELEIYLPTTKEVIYTAFNAQVRGHGKKKLIRVIEEINCEKECKEVMTCFTYDMKMVGERYKCRK